MADGLPCTKQFCIVVSETPDACTGVAVTPAQMVWSADTGGGSASGASGAWALDDATPGVSLTSQICPASGTALRVTFGGTQSGIGADPNYTVLVFTGGGVFSTLSPYVGNAAWGPNSNDIPLTAGLNVITIAIGLGFADRPANSVGTFSLQIV